MAPPLFRRRLARPVSSTPAAAGSRSWWLVWVALGVLTLATALLIPTVNAALPEPVLAPFRALGRFGLVTAYALLAGVAILAYYWPRRRESRPFALTVGAVGAVLAAFLGFFTYLPCTTSETPLWSAAYHTMALFVGSTHDPFGQAGSFCTTMPVAIEVARILALGVALGALVAVLMRVFIEQVDRLRVRFTPRLVLVTGLAEDTEDFITRLATAYDGGSRATDLVDHPDPTMRELADDLLRDERRERADIVVVEPNRGHPLIPRLRQAGVRVITGDPTRFYDLGLPDPRRVRAAYILGLDSSSNMRGAKQLLDLLSQGKAQRGVVPAKILVRIDDTRDAEEFRRQCMAASTRSVIIDTFGPQQVTCHEIAVMVERSMADVVVLLGASSLTTTLLDELAQASRELTAAGGHEHPAEVIVIDPHALSLVEDHRFRQAWYDNKPLKRIRGETAPHTDDSLMKAIGAASRPFVVDCRPPFTDGRLLAHRCLQEWRLATVLSPDAAAKGVEPDSGVTGLHRYAPSLLCDGDIPEDRWGRAARIMHLRYVSEHGMVVSPAGRRPWELLSNFYRISNLRVLTHAMQLATTFEEPRVWRPLSESQRPTPPSPEDVNRCLAHEHDDWLAYYKRGGWAYGPKRDETLKRHEMLLPFSDFDDTTPLSRSQVERRSRGIVEDAFELLAVLGYSPYLSTKDELALPLTERRPGRWARIAPAGSTGPVFGEPLQEETTWEFSGQPMTAAAGDLQVGDRQDEWSWSIGRRERNRTYLKLADKTFARIGWVTARRAAPGEPVMSREGSVKASADQWVVRDDFGHEWLMEDVDFRRKHLPLHSREP